MKEIPVTFRSHGKQLIGILHLPRRKNPPVIIMLHGWGMGKAGNPQFTYVRFARELAKNGFAALRFDFRGVGDSKGVFKDYTLTTNLEDLSVVLKVVEKRHDIDCSQIGLLGWSMGGEVAILAAAKDKRINCVVTWAAPADLKDLWSEAQFTALRKKKIISDEWSGLPVFWSAVKENLKYVSYKSIQKLRIPVLIINGTEDELVPLTQAEKLFKNAEKPKKLVLIKDADHGFYQEKHKKELFTETLSWFKKWLD